MSKMELRSSRSRSRTPFFTQELIEQESSLAGYQEEKKVVRTSRRTTVVKTNETASSSTDEINTVRDRTTPPPVKITTRKSGVTKSSERSLRNRVFKTSDYSSEDGGDNEVSSSKTVRQNERNQLVEDARTLANGSEMPALELYRRSGRYWDVYPKTDWTYSYHSKDRVEIAPGVVAMPNMSRKTIHSLDESMYSENVSHKNVNTEDMFTARYSSALGESAKYGSSEDYYIKRRTVTRWSSFKQTITTVFSAIFSLLYYTYRAQVSIFSQIHRVASKVMLWDTYLLWKGRPGDKATKLALLCLIPLLIFGGLWLLSTLGGALYALMSNYTTSNLIPTPTFWRDTSHIKFDHDAKMAAVEATQRANVEEKIVKITEKIYVEPPSASEVAGSLTNEQIDSIAAAVSSEKIIEKIINNPSFVNVINNYYQKESVENSKEETLDKHTILIDKLMKEIETMKQDITLNNKMRHEDYARLSLNMRKCCEKRPVINIEGYVSGVVTDLLNNPEFLSNQKGLNAWLHSLFLAKQDLEYHLGNLTASMDQKLASMVQTNSHLIMEKVAAKLTPATVAVGNTDEAFVKKIVKDALAVYDADRTGLVDYAMETMGGQIVTTRCSEPYHYGKAVVSILGIPLWHMSNTPRTVITPTIAPGDCWAFQNFPGFVVVKLSARTKVEAFSMEHISKLLIPDGKMDSAPKDFEVYGLREENDRNPVLLGSYRFEYDGDPLQFFLVSEENQIFDMVEIRILSNHGNPNYTCLYRFRVHGKLHHGVR